MARDENLAGDAFWSARLKLRRSDRHLSALHSKISRFFGESGKEVFTFHEDIEVDRNGREWKVTRCVDVARLPEDWSLIAGDFVHNLRAALDHSVCALVRRAERQPTRGNAFPIFSDDRPESMERMLAGVSDEQAEPIRMMQPLRNPGSARSVHLLTLQRLNNLDKHQVVQACAVSRPSVTDWGYRKQGKGRVIFPSETAPLAAGDEIMRVSADPKEHVKVQVALGANIGFGDALTTPEQLRELRNEVSAILDEIDPLK